MNLLTSLERASLQVLVAAQAPEIGERAIHRRYLSYRILVRLATLSTMITLAAWLIMSRGPSM
jgi:hypothetical protein